MPHLLPSRHVWSLFCLSFGSFLLSFWLSFWLIWANNSSSFGSSSQVVYPGAAGYVDVVAVDGGALVAFENDTCSGISVAFVPLAPDGGKQTFKCINNTCLPAAEVSPTAICGVPNRSLLTDCLWCIHKARRRLIGLFMHVRLLC